MSTIIIQMDDWLAVFCYSLKISLKGLGIFAKIDVHSEFNSARYVSH